MFYDLNVSWTRNDPDLQTTLAFLVECRMSHSTSTCAAANLAVGYNVVALNHTISGKLPADLV
jgi:ribonuclease P/MRP protein subunit RPP1